MEQGQVKGLVNERNPGKKKWVGRDQDDTPATQKIRVQGGGKLVAKKKPGEGEGISVGGRWGESFSSSPAVVRGGVTPHLEEEGASKAKRGARLTG